MLTPDSVSTPVPVLPTEPVPVITFDRLAADDWLKVSDPLTSMLPLMVEPDSNVSVLAPPLKVMALARVTPSPPRPPLIVPLLMMARF